MLSPHPHFSPLTKTNRWPCAMCAGVAQGVAGSGLFPALPPSAAPFGGSSQLGAIGSTAQQQQATSQLHSGNTTHSLWFELTFVGYLAGIIFSFIIHILKFHYDCFGLIPAWNHPTFTTLLYTINIILYVFVRIFLYYCIWYCIIN